MKLTDFGLAKRISPEEIAKTEAGTAIYYAPEMILRTGYNKEIDFWEMGVYLFEMSVYVPPFNTSELKEKQKIKKIVIDAETKRDWKESNLSPELKDLINRLLKFDPQSRIGVQSWKEIKTHAFFNGFDWKQLEDMTMPSPLKGLIEKYPI